MTYSCFSLFSNILFAQEIQLDLNDGYVLAKKADNISKIGDIPHSSLPRLGETLTLELREIGGDGKTCELKFYRDNEVIGKFMVPRHRYLPSLEVGKIESSVETKLSVMVHPLMKDVSFSCFQVWLRLVIKLFHLVSL